MAHIVTTLPATPVTSSYAILNGYSNIYCYRKLWRWQVIEPYAPQIKSIYFYPGSGPYYDMKLTTRDIAGDWAPKKISFIFGCYPRGGPEVWGSWLTFYTYAKLYKYQAWGVDKHEVEYYGEIKEFYRPID